MASRINGHPVYTRCGFCHDGIAVAHIGQPICDACSRDPEVNPAHAFRTWRTRIRWFAAQYREHPEIGVWFVVKEWLGNEMRHRP